MAGCETCFTIAAPMRWTSSGGVPAGASTPVKFSTIRSGRPACATVGTSGRSALRSRVVMASARSEPFFT
ncbi:hypothetical protein D3C85_1368030 [compost metagenome]